MDEEKSKTTIVEVALREHTAFAATQKLKEEARKAEIQNGMLKKLADCDTPLLTHLRKYLEFTLHSACESRLIYTAPIQICHTTAYVCLVVPSEPSDSVRCHVIYKLNLDTLNYANKCETIEVFNEKVARYAEELTKLQEAKVEKLLGVQSVSLRNAEEFLKEALECGWLRHRDEYDTIIKHLEENVHLAKCKEDTDEKLRIEREEKERLSREADIKEDAFRKYAMPLLQETFFEPFTLYQFVYLPEQLSFENEDGEIIGIDEISMYFVSDKPEPDSNGMFDKLLPPSYTESRKFKIFGRMVSMEILEFKSITQESLRYCRRVGFYDDKHFGWFVNVPPSVQVTNEQLMNEIAKLRQTFES